MTVPRVRKAVAYVVDDVGRLLVFTHRDVPLTVTGVQVPAGTVRPDEAPADAALRETREETGRTAYELVRALGVEDYRRDGVVHERHFFQLRPAAPLPETWEAAEEHDGLREPTPLTFWWLPLGDAQVLAGGLSARLDYVRAPS